MTRFIRQAGAELSGELSMALLIGPVVGDGLTDEDLAMSWDFFGEQIMSYRKMVGTRPRGWWTFEQGEDPPDGPDAERVRLAELDDTEEELAALAERANEASPDRHPRRALRPRLLPRPGRGRGLRGGLRGAEEMRGRRRSPRINRRAAKPAKVFTANGRITGYELEDGTAVIGRDCCESL